LSERDACSKSSDKTACTKERYLQRIADLQAQFKLVPSHGPVHFVCNGDPGNVLVAQYFDSDPATARFTHDGRTVTAFVQRSGRAEPPDFESRLITMRFRFLFISLVLYRFDPTFEPIQNPER